MADDKAHARLPAAATHLSRADRHDLKLLWRLGAAFRPTRPNLDVLADFWRSGLMQPTDRLFGLVPRDAFPQERAVGGGPLLESQLVAFPDPDDNARYMLLKQFDHVTLTAKRLQREEAWAAGRDAVLNDRAEFTLLNGPGSARPHFFSPIGAKCVVYPDGRGAWLCGMWGDDGPPRHEAALSKADCLAHAEACVANGGEARITNFVPLSQAEWRAFNG